MKEKLYKIVISWWFIPLALILNVYWMNWYEEFISDGWFLRYELAWQFFVVDHLRDLNAMTGHSVWPVFDTKIEGDDRYHLLHDEWLALGITSVFYFLTIRSWWKYETKKSIIFLSISYFPLVFWVVIFGFFN